jgi:cysteinyl-tRNA synthetase
MELNAAIRKVTEKTANQFDKDVKVLGNLEPDMQPRATENIAEMQALITTLLDKGHAYQAGGEVLFAVDSMADYGQLSGRNLEDNIAGARVAVESHKRNPADFVLWKLSSAEEPGWDSPWGRGRPGWHIECSAMSERYLGQVFDIHGGGLDLIFPHHENELAQSRCAHGTHAMASIWMHNGFLQVEGQKMSKSLGNFFTIAQLLETEDFGGRKWPGEVLRLAMLMTQYREPIDFSVSRLEEATQRLEKWERFAKGAVPATTVDPQALAALADDLDIGRAILRAHELIVDEGKPAEGLAITELLGIKVLRETAVDAGTEAQVAARLAALAAKNFAEADRIRAALLADGVQLMDYKDAETGERRTKWEVKR